MNLENLMMKLFVESINAMGTAEWEWPNSWNMLRKNSFLTQSLNYAEKHELYEQCAIIKRIQDDLDQKKN